MTSLAPSHSNEHHEKQKDRFIPPPLPPTTTSWNNSNNSIRNSYAKLQKVGEGTYASVFLAKNVNTGKKVAIKKIKVVSSKDGMDVTAIREVKFLREFNHCNVIALIDVFSSGSVTPSLNMVLEFLPTDLEALIKDRDLVFTSADIKSWMGMLLRGLEYCHKMCCLHRDLKPNNLLISPSGELKIADFGLAREFGDPHDRMTSQVITRWYRPPELLLGSRLYSAGVDMWSVGTIFAEMLLRTPYLPGETDLEQLTTIFKALGTPNEKEWPFHKTLPDYYPFDYYPKTPLSALFTAASNDTLDLLSKLLLFDPLKRISAEKALLHPYFKNDPKPTLPIDLPKHKKATEAGKPEGVGNLVKESGERELRRKVGANVDEGLKKVNGNSKITDQEAIERRKLIARKLAF